MRTIQIKWAGLSVLTLVGLSACRAIAATAIVGTAAVVGGAYYVGYGVYKGGEAVVTTVGDAGSAVGGAVTGGYQSVVVSNGTLKAKSEYQIADLYFGTGEVFRDAGFRQVGGQYDALNGERTAKNSKGDEVSVKFSLLDDATTEVTILIGDGNLKQSQFIFDRMVAETAKAKKGGAQ